MWDSPNSPWKGQPFDPTKFNLPALPPDFKWEDEMWLTFTLF